jgi:hypothetical protein
MDRRPLLLNSVLLRQNPHNVVEWQKRYVREATIRIHPFGGSVPDLASANLFYLNVNSFEHLLYINTVC